MLEVKYVKMPISIEEKKEYNRQGFRVVDDRFATAGEVVESPKEETPRRQRRAKSED